ncbi:MAG: glycerol kinase GlpK [Phycisphaerae bacterium]|nr:glycerol kinase GlpK [Phycisphaerae bacterium]
MKYVLAIDQSTSATKVIIFSLAGKVLAKTSIPHRQYYPQPGWVEHDAEEIFTNTRQALRQVIEGGKLTASDLLCLSITNQRETIVVFDRQTGKPLHHALIWQDRRGDELCTRLTERGAADEIRNKTGLKIDSYFSASKIKWLIDNKPDIAAALASGQALIGTVDTYLIYRLTAYGVFATDHTNACRTMLYDILNLRWDSDLCEMFSVPLAALPEVRSSSADFGQTDLDGLLDRPVTIRGVMGDSQAALFAQRCFEPGDAKVTFGTGSSVLVNIGSQLQISHSGLVSTIAWMHDGQATYAYEGIINCTGATIAWLKDQLQLIDSPEQTEELATSVPDNGGVYLVPALAGLGCPHWRPDAKAAVVGLTSHSNRNHVVRAALESIAYQVRDVLDCITSQADVPLTVVRGNGGMVANSFLMQFVADITSVPLLASQLPELSALGAGVYSSLDELTALNLPSLDYRPAMPADLRRKYYQGWTEALRCVL